MKNLIANKYSIILAFVALCTMHVSAQKKSIQSYDVGDDVTIYVNTSHTNIIFETWNKNKVEVEAFIEGEGLTKEEEKELFDNWNFEVLGNNERVVITSTPDFLFNNDLTILSSDALKQLQSLGPLLKDINVVSAINVPELPIEVFQNMGDLKFDYDAFNRDEEAYMKKWEKEIEKKFGKDFEIKMEKWGDEFSKEWEEKHGEKLSKEIELKMEAWGEKFGKEMEEWGEKFGEDMEKWTEEFKDENGNYTKNVITTPNGTKTIIMKSNSSGNLKNVKAKKTLIIRMPKNSKTEIEVRHGEIKMADATNVKATLNYTSFTANSIDGGETLINAAYAPVVVNNWKYGTLYVKFIDNCSIGKIESINLRANSSDVLIGTIINDATLTGSLGNFRIDNIANNFGNISITLKNADAVIKIPNAAFTFLYDGKRSTLKYPKTLSLTNSKKGDRVLVNGFNKNKGASNTISFNALYSNVSLQ